MKWSACDGSAYMMCAEASGRTYAQTLAEIVEFALARYPVEEEDTPVPERPWQSSDWMQRRYAKTPAPRACPKCGAEMPRRRPTEPGDSDPT